MKLHMRGGRAVIAITAAAFAAGCGAIGGGSGATEAARDSAALDLVPKDSVGYVTFDTDFSGDDWEQFNELATAFDPDFEGVETELSESASKGEEEVDYEQDIKPWLGESAGIALLGAAGADEEMQFFAWAELEDRAKFEAFAKDQGLEQGEKVGDFETFTDPDDETSHIAYDDEQALIADSRERLEKVVEYDGESITEAEGVEDAIDEVGDDALAMVVLSGEGLRAAIADQPQLASLKDAQQLQDFESLAISVSAEDDGMRLRGFASSSGEEEGENISHPVFESLPADTVFAVGGNDFGGGLQRFAEEAGKGNAQVQQGIGQATAALGVDLDDLAGALDGEFAIAMSADDEGLGSLAGGVAGAAMGGGLRGVDPSALARSASVILAFEETGETSQTLEKLADAVSGLAGATGQPKTGTSGEFETRQHTVSGFPVTTASSDDVAALTIGADVFDEWGKETLADSESFSNAWEAADAPDESAGILWLDVARVAKLAGRESNDKAKLGGLVGWVESDGSDARFGAFLHVEAD